MNINYKKLKLPNFTTILLRLQTNMEHDSTFLKRFNDKVEESVQKHNYKITDVDLDFDCFTQIWGTTFTGFDTNKNHEAMFGGDMMTEVYTTVVFERVTEIYYIFFDNELCYVIYNPNEKFFIDLKEHNMAPLSLSKMLYEDKSLN